jgi:hypothetical protein
VRGNLGGTLGLRGRVPPHEPKARSFLILTLTLTLILTLLVACLPVCALLLFPTSAAPPLGGG